MGWLDTLARLGGTVGGGIVGSFIPGLGTMAGAGLGAGVGNALAGLLGGDDSEMEANKQLWQATLNELTNPTGDRRAALDMLKRMASTSDLLPEEKARLMEAALEAGQFANSREQALLSDAQARGGGQAIGGQTLALQQGAAQAAGQRYAHQASQAAGQASLRQQAAIRAFNDELDRAMHMRLAATGGLSGMYTAAHDLAERRNEAQTQTMAGLGNTLAGVGMWLNDPIRKALAGRLGGPANIGDYTPGLNMPTLGLNMPKAADYTPSLNMPKAAAEYYNIDNGYGFNTTMYPSFGSDRTPYAPERGWDGWSARFDPWTTPTREQVIMPRY